MDFRFIVFKLLSPSVYLFFFFNMWFAIRTAACIFDCELTYHDNFSLSVGNVSISISWKRMSAIAHNFLKSALFENNFKTIVKSSNISYPLPPSGRNATHKKYNAFLQLSIEK